MTIFLIALMLSVIGALPALVARQAKLFALLLVAYFCGSAVWAYINLPCLDYPLGSVGWPALILSLVTSLLVVRLSSRKQQGTFSFISLLPSAVMLLTLFGLLISGCGAFNTEKYSALAGDMTGQGGTLKHWSQQTQELSPAHVRIVPHEHAIAIGKTALNQNADAGGNIVGSQFDVAEQYTTLQKVNGELVYVIPLDYRTYGTYAGTDGVPGYIMVNAEDQHAVPKFMSGYKLTYMPGAYWEKNLLRHLYTHGYASKILTDYSFEIDDKMKPWWVVSVCHHTIGMYSGIVVDGVVIVDPQSGDAKYYEKNTAPSWVDRVIPMEVLSQNLGYWGRYLNGYWNQTFIGRGVNLRRPESTVLNYGADGTCWYVTPLTSNNESDATMTDMVYTNSRTGVSKRYTVSGATEESIANTIDAGVKFQNLHAAAIVYENLGGRLTALVPILADDHSIRGLGLVDVISKSMSWDPDPANAIVKYQNSLGSLGAAVGSDPTAGERSYAGKLSRIHENYNATGNIYYLYFAGNQHIFAVPQSFHKVLVTEPGDSVEIRYLETTSDIIPVTHFNNKNLNIQQSPSQKEVTDRVEQRRSEEPKDTVVK